MSGKRVFVAGCGFVGLSTARLFVRSGWDVAGCTHSAESAAALAGESFSVYACDLGDRASVMRLAEHGPFDVVIHCASSGRGGPEQYRRVYFDGAHHLVDVLSPRLLIFTSSTSVYAQTSGEWVTEESPAEPVRETGRILRETEDFVLSRSGAVARIAGIYGPARSVLLGKFLTGEAVIEGDGSRWINQAHRDDIASALFAIATHGESGIFNIADDEPISQRALYERLAKHFQRPLPPTGPVDSTRKRGWTHKRVSNAKLRALGWQPRFSSIFDAVEYGANALAP
jgi:nucleoside-diphosphate-sugar epimerase